MSSCDVDIKNASWDVGTPVSVKLFRRSFHEVQQTKSGELVTVRGYVESDQLPTRDKKWFRALCGPIKCPSCGDRVGKLSHNMICEMCESYPEGHDDRDIGFIKPELHRKTNDLQMNIVINEKAYHGHVD